MLEHIPREDIRRGHRRGQGRSRQAPRLLQALAEPFAVSYADETRRLTGDGGDDVFFGYSFLRHAWMAQRIARRLPAVAAAVWNQAGFVIPELWAACAGAKNFLGYATGGLGPFIRAHDGLPYYRERGILGEALAGRELAQRQIPPSLASARAAVVGILFGSPRTSIS